MGRKRRKRRGKLTRPKPLLPVTGKPPLDAKYWLGIAIAILSLILTAIALQTKATVSLEAPLDPRDVLSTPVVITNDGLWPLKNVEVASFFIMVEYPAQSFLAIEDIGDGYIPPNETLDVGEKETVSLARFLFHVAGQAGAADVALIVTYHPQFLPFFKRTRVFRFKTVHQANGTERLEMQPADHALEEYRTVRRRVLGKLDKE